MTEWSDRFGDLLNALGWPGDSLLSASEQKAVEGWKLALSDLAALDFVSGPVPFEIALGKLRRILLSNSGAETGNWSSPVQILDADDAFGLAFDSAFIAGLSEETWLLPQPLNPFLPAQLQRLFHVSGSAPDDLENERYRKAESLFAVAPLIVGSYSGRLAALAKSFSAKSSRALALWAGRSPLESFPPVSLGPALTDDQAPPFESMEAASGGVSIMKSQSLCPFRAFAEYRLQAQRPEDACFGLDARDRGGYLHKALENVWKVLQTSARLRSTDPQRLQAIVQQAVQQAVHDGEGGPFHQVINRTERERLEALILQWFSEFESTRRTPFSVEQVEEKRSVEIAGLHLRLRVDRIDRLEDGTVLLLDYKSGKLSEKDLLGERPSEPQLLVYAAAVDEPVDGIFIAQVRARELKVIGAAAHDHFPGPKRSKLNWEEMRDSSRHNLKAIAAEFMAGDAVVDPKPGACTYCNLKPLCRIEERGQAREDEDSAD
jgi:ATP-dependent helicase/nuclease subunit B